MATLRDVAGLARVSTTTVSRLLSGDPGLVIPEETRDRILRAAEQVGYVSKSKPRSIGRFGIQRVGIVALGNEQWERDDPYFRSIRRGIEQESRRLGFSESVHVDWFEQIQSYVQFNNFDGLIVVGDNRVAAEHFRHRDQRVVFVDHCPDIDRYDSVVVDFARATYSVLDHLTALGHTRIAYMGGVRDYGMEDARLHEYRGYMAFKGRYRREDEHIADGWLISSGYDMAQECMSQGNLASAFMIASDPMAIGAIRAFTEAGIRVPEDVAVVGFDDVDVAAFVTPPLTTVHVPTEIMGCTALNILVDGVGRHSLPMQVTLPTELKIRESCGVKLASLVQGG